MYIVELNGKRYGIEVSDKYANVVESIDLDKQKVDEYDAENIDIPDLPAFDDENDEDSVIAYMPGRIINIKIRENDSVRKGDVLMISEAMKMESEIISTKDGIIGSVFINEGDNVQAGTVLIEYKEC